MFRHCPEPEYDELSEGGTRYLFRLDHFEFRDTLDGEGFLHFFVTENAADETIAYETDQASMYEFMARYLAGAYEKDHYQMERSPTHAALLDVMEIATARARSGDPGFSFDHAEDGAEEMDGADGADEEDWRQEGER